jgi:hypothetical protein
MMKMLTMMKTLGYAHRHAAGAVEMFAEEVERPFSEVSRRRIMARFRLAHHLESDVENAGDHALDRPITVVAPTLDTPAN